MDEKYCTGHVFDDMRKRLLIKIIIAAFIAVAAVSIMGLSDDSDAAAVQFTEDGVKYEVLDSVATDEVKVIANSYTGSVTIPKNVEHDSVTYSVTAIGDSAFKSCSSLTSVSMPSTIKKIGDQSFRGCKSLTSIILPEGLSSIGFLAFYQCSSLTSMTIPASVTSITDNPFVKCESLKEINVAKDCKDYCSVNGVLFDRNAMRLSAYPAAKADTSYSVPADVEIIGDQAFYWCTNLVSVVLPDTVTSVNVDGFYLCSSLTSVHLSESLTFIGEYAFDSCSLTAVTIPADVTVIDDRAFGGCPLTRVNILCDTPPSLGSSVFTSNPTILVPSGSLTAYKSAPGWSSYSSDTYIGLAEPEAVKGLIYSGSEKTGVRSIDTDHCNVDGNVKATNAGSYAATVSIKDTDEYRWADGTSDPKICSWTIGKAAPTASDFVMKAPSELKYDGKEKIAEVTIKEGIVGMGAYAVGYSNNVSVGTCVVTVSVAEGDNYTAGKVDVGSFAIECNYTNAIIGVVFLAVLAILLAVVAFRPKQ